MTDEELQALVVSNAHSLLFGATGIVMRVTYNAHATLLVMDIQSSAVLQV